MATASKKAPPAQSKPTPSASVPATTEKNTALPSFMQKDAGRGLENLETSDYEMPRIKLLQGISEELTNYDGLKAGDFFHTLAEKSLSSMLNIVPLYISKRYVLWRPRWDGGGILARADDAIHWQPPRGQFEIHTDKSKKNSATWKLAPTVAESGLAEWGTFDPDDPNSQPAATLCYVVVVELLDHPDLSPVALMLQRTAISPARRFMGKLKVSQAPMYGNKFIMTSFDDSSQMGDFKNYRFQMAGLVSSEADYERYKQIHENFARTGVTVKDLEGAQDEGGNQEAREAAAKNQSKY